VTPGAAARDADVVIVGLGALGSAAAYWASRRPGLRVVALEQYEIGHPYGASEDVSRIVRLSYHRREYVRLARRALASWAEVEAASRRPVIVRTGGLDVGPRETADGVAIDLSEYVASMEAEGVPFERLDADEIMRRWPAWHLDERHTGLFQADAGLADPSHGNTAHRELARAQGAELRDRARVVGVGEAGGEVVVALADGSALRAGSVILATDAWTNDLLAPLGLELPLTVTQEQVSWLAPTHDAALFDPERFPVWIWMDEPSFYGFPTWSLGGPKIGQDVGGKPVTPATRTFERDSDAWARTMAFLGEHLPAMAAGSVLQTKTCLYTLTPDRDFVLDRLPGHDRTWLVLGSAHAYKFASVLGRILVELAVDGGSPSQGELGMFRFDRPILHDPDRVTTFVI
jgi:sarcosine oxidase